MSLRPPLGFADWLDWCVQNAEYYDLWIERDCEGQPADMEAAARTELAALRARIAELEQQVAALESDTKQVAGEFPVSYPQPPGSDGAILLRAAVILRREHNALRQQIATLGDTLERADENLGNHGFRHDSELRSRIAAVLRMIGRRLEAL